MKILINVFLIVICVQMIGCASTRPQFNPTELEVRPDMATVYFYRPSTLTGLFADIPILANGKNIVNLSDRQQIKRLMVPDIYKFHGRTMAVDQVSEIELLPGQINYVKAFFDAGFWINSTRVEGVHPTLAMQEISEL